jgi:oxygen-independent coproporphyrinogen-3 oxidase
MIGRRSFLPGGRLDTIYIGGGTPSLLSAEQLQGLLDHAATLWDCSGLLEVTLEANPEDLTDDYLARLSTTGFDRLSIGVQSFDDGLLRLMNRRHDAGRARAAVRAAQKAGFDNISIDLIYGVPGMTDAQWELTLDEAIALGVQHISAYHLTIEPDTAFGRQRLAGVSEEVSERQYETLRRKLGEAGFEHYEISNFALPGRRAVHNSAYWSGEPYLGVGPSAHSFDGDRRREWVVADLKKYLEAPSYEGETLSGRERRNERIMTALRTADGLTMSELSENNTAVRFLAEGLLVKRGGRVAIPPEKFLLSDHIIAALFEGGD